MILRLSDSRHCLTFLKLGPLPSSLKCKCAPENKTNKQKKKSCWPTRPSRKFSSLKVTFFITLFFCFRAALWPAEVAPQHCYLSDSARLWHEIDNTCFSYNGSITAQTYWINKNSQKVADKTIPLQGQSTVCFRAFDYIAGFSSADIIHSVSERDLEHDPPNRQKKWWQCTSLQTYVWYVGTLRFVKMQLSMSLWSG